MRTWDGPHSFETTRWTLVLEAGDRTGAGSEEALAELCRRYWYPLYDFVRRREHDRDRARDLTQAFFATLLEKNYLADADRERGRFRTFLLAALKHFLANERNRERALKRGGGATHVALDFVDPEAGDGDAGWSPAGSAGEPGAGGTPEEAYDRRWALAQIRLALERLGEEMARSGRRERFDRLGGFLTGESQGLRYRDVARQLGMSEGAVKVAVHRLRVRFGELLRDEVGRTLEDPADVDEELRHLLSVLGAE